MIAGVTKEHIKCNIKSRWERKASDSFIRLSFVPKYNVYIFCICNVFTRASYHHYLLIFEWLFQYRSVHPFKCPVILNVTHRLIFDGNIFNFSAYMHIRNPSLRLLIVGTYSGGNWTNYNHLNRYEKWGLSQ